MAYVTQTAAGAPVILPVAGQPGLQGAPGRDGTPGDRGPAGPQGMPGESAAEIRRTAAAYIPPRRLVADAGSGRARLLDPTDPTQAGLVLGFVAQEAFPGTELVILQGDLDGLVFDFGYGTAGPLYPADDGSLTRTPRRTGFTQVVGWTADGISAAVRLGPARPFLGLGGGGIPTPHPDTAQLMLAIFRSAAAGPDGLAPGQFYLNDEILERTPNGAPASGGTAAVEGALSALWDGLGSDPTTLAPGALYLSGRALACTAPIPVTPVGAPAGFLADLGVFWDSRPAGPEGLGSKKFYRNGNALERTP